MFSKRICGEKNGTWWYVSLFVNGKHMWDTGMLSKTNEVSYFHVKKGCFI